MTNLEKFPNTKDAFEAFRKWREAYEDTDLIEGKITFDDWLECKYVDPKPLTLLEAAERFIECIETMSDRQEARHWWSELCATVRREQAKSPRNCDVMTREVDQ